jgi:hypothetical protein
MNVSAHELQEYIDLKTKEGVFPEQIYLVLSEYIKSKSESGPNQTTDLFMDMKKKSREQMIEICVEDPQSIRYVSEDLRKDVDFLQSILFRFKFVNLYEYDGCGYEPFKGISKYLLGYGKYPSPVFTNKTIIVKLLEIDPLCFKIATTSLEVNSDGKGNLLDHGTNINRDKVLIIIALSGQSTTPSQVLPYVHENIFNDLPFIRLLVREETCDLSDLLDDAPISNEQKTEFQNDSELCISSVRFHSSTFHLCSIDLRSNREFVYECIDAEVISCPGKNIFPYMGEELKNDANLFRYAFQKEIRRSTESSRNYGYLEAYKAPDVFQHMGYSLRSDMIFLKSFIQDYTKSLSKNAVFNLSYLPREILDEEDFQEHCISVHKKYDMFFSENDERA